jgi:RHS repeat-associated protein
VRVLTSVRGLCHTDQLGYDHAGDVTGDTNYCYAYDAEGRRVRKPVGATSVDYLYDLAGHQITEVSSSGAWNRGEVYAGSRHIATYNNGATFFNHEDWLGTERARSNTSGMVCETITSLPYGDNQNSAGTCSDSSPMHFTGKMRDAESNLDDFDARYYSSQWGRFTIPDPLGVDAGDWHDPQGLNLFDYVRNDSTGLADPDGLSFRVCVDAGSGKKSCFTYNVDKDFYRAAAQSGATLNGGKIYAKDANGKEVAVGTYEHYGTGRDDTRAGSTDVSGDYLLLAGVARGAFAAAGLVLNHLDEWLAPAEDDGNVVIGKLNDLEQPGGVGPGERTLDLPDQGSPKANWEQNSSKIREAMAEGRPIRDASASNPQSDSGFLRAERNLLRNHGWTQQGDYWYPPKR